MDVVMLCIGAGVCLALWALVYRKLDGVARSVELLARRSLPDGPAQAQRALQEATAARVGPIVKAIRDHEAQLAANCRAQIAEAQSRARNVERASSDAAIALDAASALVRELRALVGEVAVRTAAPSDAVDPQERATVEMPRGAGPGPAMIAAGLTRPSLHALRPPPLRAPDADTDDGDSGAWSRDARDSEIEEATCVTGRGAPRDGAS